MLVYDFNQVLVRKDTNNTIWRWWITPVGEIHPTQGFIECSKNGALITSQPFYSMSQKELNDRRNKKLKAGYSYE